MKTILYRSLSPVTAPTHISTISTSKMSLVLGLKFTRNAVRFLASRISLIKGSL